ncbi:hypothetical protein ACLOJK_023330 [Asimina triloba]
MDASASLGVLGATLGETSLHSVDKEIFWCPFDTEVRALRILGDLLLVQSRNLRDNYDLGQAAPLDREERGPTELMLLEFLPDMKERIQLIDRYAFKVEYHYHMLRGVVHLSLGCPRVRDLVGMSHIMSGEERWRVIAIGKRLEEAGVVLVTREVLRPNASFSSAWECLEGSLAGIVPEALHMAEEELGVKLVRRWVECIAKGEQCFFFHLIEMDEKTTVGLPEDLNAAMFERERAKEAATELLAELDATKAKRDEALNEAKGIILAEQDLERALEETIAVRPPPARH